MHTQVFRKQHTHTHTCTHTHTNTYVLSLTIIWFHELSFGFWLWRACCCNESIIISITVDNFFLWLFRYFSFIHKLLADDSNQRWVSETANMETLIFDLSPENKHVVWWTMHSTILMKIVTAGSLKLYTNYVEHAFNSIDTQTHKYILKDLACRQAPCKTD